jgi:NAD(P)H-hydrate repair Nnr-like enzyme with NAD(P)H-hydrate epimerase domain
MDVTTQKRKCGKHTGHDNYFNGECQWCILEERNTFKQQLAAAQRKIADLGLTIAEVRKENRELDAIVDAMQGAGVAKPAAGTGDQGSGARDQGAGEE